MANLIDININQSAILIACVHIMDVIIFQKMVAGIYLLLRRLCIVCLLSRIGGRGKGSKRTRCLECIYFTIFGIFARCIQYSSHRTKRACPKEGASCVTFSHKTDTFCILVIFEYFSVFCFIIYINIRMQLL